MGPKHDRAQILDGALAAAREVGLSRLTFGRVAERLGVPDRTVVYYFPSKAELITGVLLAIGAKLQAVLAEAFTTPASDHRELVGRAWPALTTDEADPLFALYFEASGLAAVGREPYAALAPGLITQWAEWLATFFDGDDAARLADAHATMALMDGLLYLRQVGGPDMAESAARSLGVA